MAAAAAAVTMNAAPPTDLTTLCAVVGGVGHQMIRRSAARLPADIRVWTCAAACT